MKSFASESFERLLVVEITHCHCLPPSLARLSSLPLALPFPFSLPKTPVTLLK